MGAKNDAVVQPLKKTTGRDGLLRYVAIAKWTGAGNQSDLVRTARAVLRSKGVHGVVRGGPGCILISGKSPVVVAGAVKGLPGVAWVAVGMHVPGQASVREDAARLAKRYLKKGMTFTVNSEVQQSAGLASDLSGAVRFAILDAADGCRVDERNPDISFRATKDNGGTAIGVEIFKGPGGIPTGKKTIACLVSGGKHSSVAAWYALLSGSVVHMVHAKVDDASVRAVALLYAELSDRVDSGALSLQVLEGVAPAAALTKWLGRFSGECIGGFHAGSAENERVRNRVDAPLRLLPEEEFTKAAGNLGAREDPRKLNWKARGSGSLTVRKFGGVRADANRVIDGLQ